MNNGDLKQYLEALSRKSVKLWVEGDRLRYQAEEGALSAEDFQKLAEQKQEIIKLLKAGEGKKKGDRVKTKEIKPKAQKPVNDMTEKSIELDNKGYKEEHNGRKEQTWVEKIVNDPTQRQKFLDDLREPEKPKYLLGKNGNHNRRVIVEEVKQIKSDSLPQRCDCGNRVYALNAEGTIGQCLHCNTTYKVRILYVESHY